MTIGRFERMVGIPEDEYHHLKSLQQTNNPLQNKFLSLSNEYKKQESIYDAEKRVQRQGETLQAMMRIKDDLKRRLIESTPRPYRSRAQGLFQFISDKIDVNDRGEIQSTDGSLIDGSNVGDLVQHAVRDRRRNIIPKGWDSFMNILKDNNTPRMILNYETLQEMEMKGIKREKSPMKRLSFSFSGAQTPAAAAAPVKQRVKKRKLSPPVVVRQSYRTKKEPKYFGLPSKNAYF